MTEPIKLLALFVEGLLSFLSPCVIPILPVYLGILAGEGLGKEKLGEPGLGSRKILINSLFFIIGIALTFFLLAFASSLLSRFFNAHIKALQVISGLLIIVMGLYQLGAFRLGIFAREYSAKQKAYRAGQRVTPLVALLMGFTFSFSWTPCIGPILASVFFYASAHQGMVSVLLISIYCLGFILPFILLALFAEKMLPLVKKHHHLLTYTTKISGVLLLFIGLSILLGWFAQFARLFI